MTERHRPRVKYVIGPDGSPLTIADLPPTTTKRWVIRRKAEVVAAVGGGLLSLEEACARYTLTFEEFLFWQYSIDRHGLNGLSLREPRGRGRDQSESLVAIIWSCSEAVGTLLCATLAIASCAFSMAFATSTISRLTSSSES